MPLATPSSPSLRLALFTRQAGSLVDVAAFPVQIQRKRHDDGSADATTNEDGRQRLVRLLLKVEDLVRHD